MKALKRSQTSSKSASPSSSSSNTSSSSPSSSWIYLRSVLFVVASSSPASCSSSTHRGHLKSPWSRRKRKHILSSRQWRNLFTSDGKLRDGGLKFLKKVRSGGVDPSIKAEVWPFLLGVGCKCKVKYGGLNIFYTLKTEEKWKGGLGKKHLYFPFLHSFKINLPLSYCFYGVSKENLVGKISFCVDSDYISSCSYDLSSSKEDRDIIKTQKRKEYEKLRSKCRQLLKHNNDLFKLNESGEASNGDSGGLIESIGSPNSDDVVSARESLSSEERFPYDEDSDHPTNTMMDGCAGSKRVTDSNVIAFSDSSYSDSSEDPDASQTFNFTENGEENDRDIPLSEDSYPSKMEVQSEPHSAEDFATWQRIIRLDAVRASGEWIAYSPGQAAVSEGKACHSAEVVGLKDYDHLEPCRIFHAARLVAILEAYALYDPEIGYCQGMSDLLSPIITVMTEDHEAFWCFVGFMKKARHNFRLDEEGIRRQLNIVSKIIKFKDSHLFRHLEKLQAEDCFFVYRMVVVLFRRELTFEQTLCLWEIMWADQAAIRAGIGKSAWSRIRQRAPPTDDLLLYAIAASVLQRRKQIIEKYNSMDDILRECNAMAGHLDVWKLLDDAHNLVVTLHDKIETPL